MSQPLVERTLRAFSEDLASDQPFPGGGSASAYAGAIGAALAAMVARLAARKAPQANADFIAEADNLRADFLRLVDDDSAAYARVAEAYKLPKTADAEKRVRTERMQAALLAAARVPLEIAKTSRRLLEACERAKNNAPPSAASDIGVAALMGEAALRGAALNVIINLAALKDAAQVKALSDELDRAVEGAEAQRKRVTDHVESRIAR